MFKSREVLIFNGACWTRHVAVVPDPGDPESLFFYLRQPMGSDMITMKCGRTEAFRRMEPDAGRVASRQCEGCFGTPADHSRSGIA